MLTLAALSARADCIDDAALRHGVNALVLRAIGWHESRLQPLAIGHNANGTIDIGAFQINDTHLPELARAGLDAPSLADGCVSAEVAAWHYRRQVDALGNTWAAVGAYHSRTPAREAWYANQIAGVLMRWRRLPAGPLPFDSVAARPPIGVDARPSATARADETSGARRRARRVSTEPATATATATATAAEKAKAGAAARALASAAGVTPHADAPVARTASPAAGRQTPGGGVDDAVALATHAFGTLAFAPSAP